MPTEDSRPGLSPTVPMPRMRAVVEPSLVVEVTVSPGVRMVMLLMSVTPESLSCCPDKAITEIGTSCRFSERFSAVTMISVSVGEFAVSSAARPALAARKLDPNTRHADPAHTPVAARPECTLPFATRHPLKARPVPREARLRGRFRPPGGCCIFPTDSGAYGKAAGYTLAFGDNRFSPDAIQRSDARAAAPENSAKLCHDRLAPGGRPSNADSFRR